MKELCETVGFGLAKFTFQKYAGVTDASKVGFAKLTIVFEKLSDLANGSTPPPHGVEQTRGGALRNDLSGTQFRERLIGRHPRSRRVMRAA